MVVPARDEGTRVHDTVCALLPDLPADGEVVVVDDVSTDGSTANLEAIDPRVCVQHAVTRLGVAAARNLGARLSSGDLLVFADAHVQPLGAWYEPLRRCVDAPRVGAAAPVLQDWRGGGRGYGLRMLDVGTSVAWLERRGARAYDVPLLPGFFLAVRRRVFVTVGGFDETYSRWGMEDLDLSVRLWTLGYDCLLEPEVVVRHLAKDDDLPDYQRDWETNLFNVLAFGATHYGQRRWEELLAFYGDHQVLPAVVARVEAAGLRDLREPLRAARLRDDDDLFETCGRG